MNFVVAFVEVVKHLELIVGVLVQTRYLLDLHIWVVGRISVGLIERKHFFFLSFKFSAKLGGLQNLFSKALVLL